MSVLIIEPHYLGSLEYFVLIDRYDIVMLEINDAYRKQTYRNRCYFQTANGIYPLSVPVKYSNKTITKDVKVDHQQRWKKDHWGAFYSAYGKAPFFDYFAESFHFIWDKNHSYLIDLNHDFLELTLKLLRIDVTLSYSDKYEEKMPNDFRNHIIPKKPFTDRKIYRSVPYAQVFCDKFVPNLSVVDIIVCEGSHAREVLSASFLTDGVEES